MDEHDENIPVFNSEDNTSKRRIENIEEACKFAKKWLPSITETDKELLMKVLTGTERTYGTPFLRKYIELLRPYTGILGISGENNKPREADCVASGIVFFYGFCCK